MKVTEQSSNYANLDKMSTAELLQNMNNEDKKVPVAVENCIPQIEKLVDGIVERMKKGEFPDGARTLRYSTLVQVPAVVLVFWMLQRFLLHMVLHSI